MKQPFFKIHFPAGRPAFRPREVDGLTEAFGESSLPAGWSIADAAIPQMMLRVCLLLPAMSGRIIP
jgi:hypothetical protein